MARVVASTVKVTTPSGSGTAFYVGGNQWITAGHVVDNRPRSITLSNASIRVSARLVGFYYSAANGDVALLSASASGAQPLGWAGRLPQGTAIAVVGYPRALGVSASITRGYISRLFRQGSISYLQTDSASNPGNSGGPVVDACGRVAGILVSGYEDAEGLNFAVAEPTLSRKLIALGLRGYAVTPRGEYPEEYDAPPAHSVEQQGCVHPDPNTTYMPDSCIDGVVHARLRGTVLIDNDTAPDGTLLEAVVNGVVCASTTNARFDLAIPAGCGGAEAGGPYPDVTGTPIELRYDGINRVIYQHFLGSEGYKVFGARWHPDTRTCNPYCERSYGGGRRYILLFTQASLDEVREYAQCVLDYWQESAAQINASIRENSSYDRFAHTRSGIAADMRHRLWDGSCPQQQRVLLHDLARNWHAAASALWSAGRAYFYAEEEGDIGVRAKRRASDDALAAYEATECPLWTALGWECSQ